MATGYARQSSGLIINGATIQASHHNNEYDAIAAFANATTGHNHDGTAGGGASIPTAGISGLNSTSTGIICGTGSNAVAGRTLTAPAAGITVTNGTGASGNPTLALANDLAALEGLASTGIAVRSASDTWVQRTITAGSNISVTDGNGVSGNPTIAVTGIGSTIQGYDATLAALAAHNTNGLLTQTASDTFTGRTITGTSGTITVTNGNGVSGNPTITIDSSYIGQSTITTLGTITTGTWSGSTIALNKGGTGATTQAGAANAVLPTQATHSGKYLTTDGSNVSWATVSIPSAGLADPGGNGIVVRTASNTTINRSIAVSGGNIAITNGDGVSGDPTIAFTGTLPVTNGGTGQSSITANTVILGNGTSAVQTVAPSTSGNILTSNGTTWVSSPPANTGTVTSVATGDGLTGGTITSSGTVSINTNNALGVGSYALLRNNSGGATVNSGATASGANLVVAYWSTTGVLTNGSSPTGTWRNVSGRNLTFSGGDGEVGLFIRTA